MRVCLLISNRKRFIYFTTPFILSKMLEITCLAKKLLFPQFTFFEFNDDVIVNLGEVSLKLLPDVRENVQLGLDIFHETTVAAISSYFPYCNDAIGFLKLFSSWWAISNSKDQYCFGNYIGRAVFQNDNKTGFLRKWLHDLKDRAIRKYQTVKNLLSQLKHTQPYKGPFSVEPL